MSRCTEIYLFSTLHIDVGPITEVVYSRTPLIIALKGGEFLDQLLQSNALLSQPSAILGKIYALNKPPKLIQQDIPLNPQRQEFLISKDQLSEIAKQFDDNEISVLGNRALTQITKQIDEEIKGGEKERSSGKVNNQDKEKRS